MKQEPRLARRQAAARARLSAVAASRRSANELLDAAILSLPEEPSLRAERGLLARALDETDVAIEQYTKAVELSPQDAELHFNLGEALQQEGHALDDAIVAVPEGAGAQADLNAAQVNLAKALAEKGHYGEAKELLRR